MAEAMTGPMQFAAHGQHCKGMNPVWLLRDGLGQTQAASAFYGNEQRQTLQQHQPLETLVVWLEAVLMRGMASKSGDALCEVAGSETFLTFCILQ